MLCGAPAKEPMLAPGLCHDKFNCPVAIVPPRNITVRNKAFRRWSKPKNAYYTTELRFSLWVFHIPTDGICISENSTNYRSAQCESHFRKSIIVFWAIKWICRVGYLGQSNAPENKSTERKIQSIYTSLGCTQTRPEFANWKSKNPGGRAFCSRSVGFSLGWRIASQNLLI